MRDRRLRTFAAVLLSVMLLATLASIASATVKITDPLNAWDDKTNRYENGNLTLRLNDPNNPTPELEPFWVAIGFDKTLHTVPGCGTTNATEFAGDALIGLYNTDTNGAKGFQSSKNWGLVDCSQFTAPNKFPTDFIFQCVPEATNPNAPCGVVTQDVVTPCTTGNCTNEIVTTFDLVLDQDCDGVIDPQFAPPGGLCMYWAAPKPTTAPPVWNGNIQVRINSGGGDKTVNFNRLLGPNAVGLASFTGARTLDLLPVGLVVVGVSLGGLAVAWRTFVQRRNAK